MEFPREFQPVGCDLRLDSGSRVDRCGVCGGDGSTCAAAGAAFVWREAPLSRCSAPCGGGQMMAHAVCKSAATGERVHDDLCDSGSRPGARMAPCNAKPCPPRYCRFFC